MGSFLYATRLHLLPKTHIMRMKNRVKHEKEIKELNNIVAKQQEEIDQLKDMVNQLINQGGK
mgnify:CR=1 FL=1